MTMYIDLAEAADMLGLSASETYKLVRRAELPGIKLAGKGRWVLDRAAVQAYADNHRRGL